MSTDWGLYWWRLSSDTLYAVEAVGVDDGDGVVLPVDGFGFEGGVDIREGNRHGLRAQRPDPVEVERGGDHAQLQALEVGDGVDRPQAVGDLPKTQLVIGQADQPLVVQGVVHRPPEGPVEERVGIAVARQQQRQVEHREGLDLIGQDARVEDAISRVPAWSAAMLTSSEPSVPPGNTMTLTRPRERASTSSAKRSSPSTIGWPRGFCVAIRRVFSWAAAAVAMMARSVARPSRTKEGFTEIPSSWL
jgi:hypothetical protein